MAALAAVCGQRATPLHPTTRRPRICWKRYAYQDLLRGVVEQGIREGAFRPVNALLATHMLLMTIMPPAFTSRPSGTPDEMLNETLNLFLRGVQA